MAEYRGVDGVAIHMVSIVKRDRSYNGQCCSALHVLFTDCFRGHTYLVCEV